MDAASASIVTAFINSLGLPITIIVVIIGFGVFKAWPYYIERVKANDVVQARRDAVFADEMGGIRNSMVDTAKILFILEERLSNHEIAMLGRVDDIKAKIDEKYQALIREIQARPK